MGDGPGRAAATIATGNKFVVVAIEYFTRCIEAKPLAKITSEIMKVLLAEHNLQIQSTKNPNS